MSAFIVGTDHIDYLVSAAVDVGTNGGGFGIYWAGERIDWESATRVGAALLAENIASVAYRYAGSDPARGLPGPVPTTPGDPTMATTTRTITDLADLPNAVRPSLVETPVRLRMKSRLGPRPPWHVRCRL